MDILKRIDLAQQFCKQYADGAWSIETDKWNYHVTPEFIEDIRQYIESLHLKLMYLQTQQAKREVYESESFDMIDRYLRNNLHDDDYESYLAALEEVAAAPAQQAQPSDAERYRWARNNAYIFGVGNPTPKEADAIADAAIKQGAQQAQPEHPEDRYVREGVELDCPMCGGSGHKDDAKLSEPVGRVESALTGAGGFHVRLVKGQYMPEVGVSVYVVNQPVIAQQAQPERAPLDIEEINAEAREQHGDLAEECGFRSGVRWAEKRHGIKQGGQHD